MIRQCILFCCCFILCGCGLGKISGSSTEFHSEDVESSDIIEATDVNENTNYFAAYADLTFLYLFGYGGGMTYGAGKNGTLDAMFKNNN